MNWLGTEWVDGTCGESFACRAPKCVEHGSYVARLCGYALTTGSVGAGGTSGTAGGANLLPVPANPCELSASKTPTCVDVPFEYPPTGVVSGVLDPRK